MSSAEDSKGRGSASPSSRVDDDTTSHGGGKGDESDLAAAPANDSAESGPATAATGTSSDGAESEDSEDRRERERRERKAAKKAAKKARKKDKHEKKHRMRSEHDVRERDKRIKAEQKAKRQAIARLQKEQAVRIDMPQHWVRPAGVSGCAAATYKAESMRLAPGLTAAGAREAKKAGLELIEGADEDARSLLARKSTGAPTAKTGDSRVTLKSAATAVRKAVKFIQDLNRPNTTGSQFVHDNYSRIAQSGVCVVCRGRGPTKQPGCPCCWDFEEEDDPEDKFDPFNLSAAAAQRKDNRFALEGPRVGVKVICAHTNLTNHEEIRRLHWKYAFVTVLAKTLPTGDEVRFRMASHWELKYLYFQYRTLGGPSGADDKIELMLPTQVGMFHMSIERRLDTPTITGVFHGDRTLEDFHVRRDGTFLSLFRTAFIHDTMTPGMAEAFFRQNFTVAEPWPTRMHHYLDDLPDDLPSNDRCQTLLSPWLVAAMDIKEGWAREDAAKAHKAREDKKHREARARELHILEMRRKAREANTPRKRMSKRQQLALARADRIAAERERRAMEEEELVQRAFEDEIERQKREAAQRRAERREKKYGKKTGGKKKAKRRSSGRGGGDGDGGEGGEGEAGSSGEDEDIRSLEGGGKPPRGPSRSSRKGAAGRAGDTTGTSTEDDWGFSTDHGDSSAAEGDSHGYGPRTGTAMNSGTATQVHSRKESIDDWKAGRRERPPGTPGLPPMGARAGGDDAASVASSQQSHRSGGGRHSHRSGSVASHGGGSRAGSHAGSRAGSNAGSRAGSVRGTPRDNALPMSPISRGSGGDPGSARSGGSGSVGGGRRHHR